MLRRVQDGIIQFSRAQLPGDVVYQEMLDAAIGGFSPAAPSVPTGTGFRHITAGVEDAASKLVDTADVNNDQITYAKLQNVTDQRILGRIAGSSGDVEEKTAAQVTAFLAQFTTVLQGLVPASGGGTVNYLRADGTWATPPGTAGGALALNDRSLDSNFTVTAGYSAYVCGPFEIAKDVVLEIGADAILEIG